MQDGFQASYTDIEFRPRCRRTRTFWPDSLYTNRVLVLSCRTYGEHGWVLGVTVCSCWPIQQTKTHLTVQNLGLRFVLQLVSSLRGCCSNCSPTIILWRGIEVLPPLYSPLASYYSISIGCTSTLLNWTAVVHVVGGSLGTLNHLVAILSLQVWHYACQSLCQNSALEDVWNCSLRWLMRSNHFKHGGPYLIIGMSFRSSLTLRQWLLKGYFYFDNWWLRSSQIRLLQTDPQI